MRTKSIFFFVVTVALFLTGCDVDPETLESLRGAVSTISSQDPLVAHDSAQSDPNDSRFDLPHPDRVDPFSFPANIPLSDHAGTTISTVADIKVLGFAHVDQPRVFLRTKESTRSLKVGDVTDGVQVVSINAPVVELRMGNLVWTASMFEK